MRKRSRTSDTRTPRASRPRWDHRCPPSASSRDVLFAKAVADDDSERFVERNVLTRDSDDVRLRPGCALRHEETVAEFARARPARGPAYLARSGARAHAAGRVASGRIEWRSRFAFTD